MGLTKRMLIASGLLVTVVGAAFAGLLLAVADLRETGRLARQAQEVIATANHLERLMLDLQTGPRGFMITQREEFLEPWRSARAAYPRDAALLESLVADDPEQERRARAIHRAIDSYFHDYSLPLVRAARQDIETARTIVRTGRGKRLVDAIRGQFARFISAEDRLASERRRNAEADGERAIVLGAVGLGVSVLLIVVFAGYLKRTIVEPVRRVAGAAGRIAGGDLRARAPDKAGAEIGDLAAAFNGMAGSLQESRDELESQNAELELQTAELEDQHLRLSSANEELQAQQSELGNALREVAEEKERIDAFYRFGERIAAEIEAQPLVEAVLADLCSFSEAPIGTLYAELDGDGTGPHLVAWRGVDPARLPRVLSAGENLSGTALAEKRIVQTAYGETALRTEAFGEEVAVRHQIDVPICRGERILGVATLGRIEDRTFAQDEIHALAHLADQAALALSNALTFRAARREASIRNAVLDATADGIRLVDLEGNTLLANAEIERVTREIFGLDHENIYARSAAISDRLTNPEAFVAAAEALAADPERVAVDNFELRESGRAYQRYTAPVRDDSGELIGRIVVLRDVTEQRQAERLKSELVATVSHELRTPLASVLGFSELLSARELDPETQKRYLELIHREALRLTGLIDDFLDVQRIEEGSFALELEPFDLGALLRDQLEVFSGQSAQHRLEPRLPDESLEVLGERDRIAQVVGNLLSNAIKYSPEGGLVQLEAERVNGDFRVSVADSGVGIPEDQRERIFEKFFRVDSSDTREIGGTGLGLALCREIVQAHGGQIGFESIEGAGSTFWFTLPAGQTPGAAKGLVVLVIEDGSRPADAIADHLVRDELAVERAAGGDAGLACARKLQPALICLDVALGGEPDGWQVLSSLKGDPKTAMIPVLVWASLGEGKDAAMLGAADVLAKPFEPEHLRAAIARLLPGGGGVLVVDDEEAVRRLVFETLSGHGFELREATDGAEALEAIRARRPDALVLDLMMPNVDGFAVLDRLQEDPATRQMPVVVLTARRLSAQERNLLQRRSVGLLEKSRYSPTELRRVVRSALGH